jgi:hypothetical protein
VSDASCWIVGCAGSSYALCPLVARQDRLCNTEEGVQFGVQSNNRVFIRINVEAFVNARMRGQVALFTSWREVVDNSN